MKRLLLLVSLISFSLASVPGQSQNVLSSGNISGNFELNAQYYAEDSLIGAPKVPEKILMNAFANLLYSNGNFTAGIRFESYLNPLLGYDPAYAGSGIPYRFANYKMADLEVTLGNFYEQFGNGLIFRAYEEKTLGIDNSVDGIRVKYNPWNGISLKGIAGRQRYYWEKSEGILRGFDAEFSLNEMFPGLAESKTRIILGGSALSKFQKDDPTSPYKLPENVAAFAGRAGLSYGKVRLTGEYAFKINDPSVLNHYIYKPGEALFLQASYSQKGIGVTVAAKRIDNMNFRSDRTVTGSPLTLSYLPPLTRQHAYSLASVYPYASQPNGEIGYYAELIFKLKKGSTLGGFYGTDVSLNFSRVNALDTQHVAGLYEGSYGYHSEFLKFGKDIYFQDFNIEISRKINSRVKAIFSYLNLIYNLDVIEGHPGEPMVYANVGIADITYKFTEKKALRMEAQLLTTKQDKGDWAQLLFEYTLAPKWFFTVMDQYNYGNADSDKQLHYYLASIGFNKGTSRIALAYGRQREGILCVGGVCRAVPASNGLQLSISSSF